MAASTDAIKRRKVREPEDATVSDTFSNPETRERWEWVQTAISFAEDDSNREFECRFTEDVATAVSPFMEE